MAWHLGSLDVLNTWGERIVSVSLKPLAMCDGDELEITLKLTFDSNGRVQASASRTLDEEI